jgi:hypothetical protein
MLAKAAGMADPLKLKMQEKERFTVSVPPHVGDAVRQCARTVSATPTEYAADILRWWFGQGCPALSEEESVVRDAMEDTGLPLQLKKKRKQTDQ